MNTTFNGSGTGNNTYDGTGTDNTLDYSGVTIADYVEINLMFGTVLKKSGGILYTDTFFDIQNFIGSGGGYSEFDSIGTGDYTFTGLGTTNALDYYQDANGVTIDLATDTVTKDPIPPVNKASILPGPIFQPHYQDSFSDIQTFVGSGGGNTLFDSIGTGDYTFIGLGTNNTLDYSNDANGVTIDLTTFTVTKDLELLFRASIMPIPIPHYQDTFSGIQNFVGNASASETIIFSGASNQYQIVDFSNGSVTVTDTVAGRDGTINLDNIGNLQFTDKTIEVTLVVSSISAAADNNTNYVNAGHLVTITMTTNETATVTGTPTLQLNDNEVAGYIGGSGTNTLTFAYAVQPGDPGDNVADLQVTGLNLPSGATIKDQAGNSLSGTVTGDLGIQVDTTTVPATSVQQEIFGLYAALYNRATDFGGFSYWAGVVGQQPDGAGVTTANAGTTAITTNDATVLGQLFVNTQATYFNAAYGSLSDSDFITDLYINLAGNAVNIAPAIAYWGGLLQTAEAAGESVQAARAGLVGQIVHDMVDYNVNIVAPGYTAAQWQGVVQRQETIDNKIVVSEAISNASQQPGGNILVVQTVGDAAFEAATTVIQGVTYDPATVTAAILGINNAVAHQNLLLI